MNNIILFDGECNFCDASVQFIIKRDSKGLFKFASLQGIKGRELLERYGTGMDIDSFLLLTDNALYSKSSAAVRVAKELDGFWKMAYCFIVIPAPVRNFVYNIIAKNRYKWFGKKESCMLPSPEIRNRFLD